MCAARDTGRGQLLDKIAEYGNIVDAKGCMWRCSRGGILPDVDIVDSFLCERYC